MDAMADFDQFLSQCHQPVQMPMQKSSVSKIEDLVDELLTARGIAGYQRNTGAERAGETQTTVQPYSATSFADNFWRRRRVCMDDDPWVVNFREDTINLEVGMKSTRRWPFLSQALFLLSLDCV